MEPENKIDICKFYIKKCCKHGLGCNNCNYKHPAPCKKYIKNPVCRCKPEYTNYHPDICNYFMQFRKCYNMRCYRIVLKRIMHKRSQQEQHRAPSHQQTNLFHNPSCPANSAFANKSQKTTCFFNPHITRTLINYNTYSHNPILPYSHSWTSSSPNSNSEQPLSPRHNLSRQHTTVQSPSHPPQHYCQNDQPIAKIKPNTQDQFSFLFKKMINLQHQLDNTAGANGSAKKRKQVY